MARNSHLKRQKARKIVRQTILQLFGIILIIGIIVRFGIPALVSLSLFIAGTSTDKTERQQKQTEFVAQPVINTMYTATNSATVTITGLALENQTIKLYLNDELIGKKETDNDGEFVFENVQLSQEESKFTAKAINKSGDESDYSETISIRYKKDPPIITIDTPSENQSFSKDEDTIEVLGKTDTGTTVTVNGFRAIVNTDSTYSYTLRLHAGDNTIKVIAFDEAGNKSETERKVTYYP